MHFVDDSMMSTYHLGYALEISDISLMSSIPEGVHDKDEVELVLFGELGYNIIVCRWHNAR